MIHGARAVISRLSKHDDRRSVWLKALVARRGFNRTIVALANKTARRKGLTAVLSAHGKERHTGRVRCKLPITTGSDSICR
jgi:hypothetical protein